MASFRPKLRIPSYPNEFTYPLYLSEMDPRFRLPLRGAPARSSNILIRRPYALVQTTDNPAGKTLFEESRAICLRAARTNALMLGHYIAINLPWLTPSTRETLVMLVMNGLHLHKSSPRGGEGETEREQEILLQNCVDILQLMGRVGVHVADMANMLRELATPITTTNSP
ncbi:hypothetical protein FRC10_003430 [Ceratobasidium sp. 414]|nr:hypothetical protein FRC10_003430 [Ceratobasidium sp. 414]